MKVFVVTSGSYSDYQIDAIFTTKKLAEAYITAINLTDANSIEQWELDPCTEEVKNGLSPFHVFMAKDGKVRLINRSSYDFDKYCRLSCYFPRDENSVVELECHCWAKDEQHAIKIANEKRAQIIAMNLWREVSEMPKNSAIVSLMV